MADYSDLNATLARRDELLAVAQTGRLNSRALRELNNIQIALRTKHDYNYSQAPNYRTGALNARRGIGGFNTPSSYNPNLPADQQTEQKEGTVVQQDGYTYQYDDQGGFNTISRPFGAQRYLDETIRLNNKINRGDKVYAGDLAYGRDEVRLIDQDVVLSNNRRVINPDSRVASGAKASTFQDQIRQDTQRRTARVEELRKLGLDNAQIVTFEKTGVLPEGYAREQDGKLFVFDSKGGFSTKPSFNPFPLTIQENRDKTRAGRLSNAISSFAGASPKRVTNVNQLTPFDFNVQDPAQRKDFLIPAGYTAVAMVPGTWGLVAGGSIGAYATAQQFKHTLKTGEGKGSLALSVGLTAIDAYLLKGALKGKLSTKLISSQKIGETAFEFNLANRAGLKATPVLGSQKNIVALRVADNAETLELLSLQPKISGSRTVATREIYKSIFGTTSAVRLTEQGIIIKNLRIGGATKVQSGGQSFFEIPLSGQGKVEFTQRSLTIPESQFGLSVKDKVKPSMLRGDIFTDSTIFSYQKPRQALLLSPTQAKYDLDLVGNRVVAVDKRISKRNFFSIKDADRSNSPFAFATERAGGSVFLSGRFTSVDTNVGQIGLDSTYRINAAGGRPVISRSSERFLNQVQPRKPQKVFDENIIISDTFQVNPVDVIAKTRPTFKYRDGDEYIYRKIPKGDDERMLGFVFRAPHSPIFLSAKYASGESGRAIRYHEAGHLFDYANDFNFSDAVGVIRRSRKKYAEQKRIMRTEYSALKEAGLIQNNDFFAGYKKSSIPSELVAEFTKARALNPRKFAQLAPNLEEKFSKFDATFHIRKNLGTRQVEVSGSTPSKTLTAVDSGFSSGELISKEARRTRRQITGGEVVESDMLLQFGKVRPGATERAPLLDINEFDTFSDSISIKPSKPKDKFGFRVKSIDEQMNIKSSLTKEQEADLNKAFGQTGNIFDDLVTKPQKSAFDIPRSPVDTQNFADTLSRSVIKPTPALSSPQDFRFQSSPSKSAQVSFSSFGLRPQATQKQPSRSGAKYEFTISQRSPLSIGSPSRSRYASNYGLKSFARNGSRSASRSATRTLSRSRPGTLPTFDTRLNIVPAQKQSPVSRISQKIVPKQTLKFNTRIRQPVSIFPSGSFYSPPRPPSGGIRLGKLNKSKKKRIGYGFDVFVKDGSKGFVKVNTYSQSFRDAASLGNEVVDNSAARSFKILSSRTPIGPRESSYSFNANAFRPSRKLPNVFVEKNKFAIDTQGEVQNISAKGWMAQRKARAFRGLLK